MQMFQELLNLAVSGKSRTRCLASSPYKSVGDPCRYPQAEGQRKTKLVESKGGFALLPPAELGHVGPGVIIEGSLMDVPPAMWDLNDGQHAAVMCILSPGGRRLAGQKAPCV